MKANNKGKVKTKKPGYIKQPNKAALERDRWNKGGEGVVSVDKMTPLSELMKNIKKGK